VKNKTVNTSNELIINDVRIPRDTRVTLDLNIAKLYTHTPVSIPVHVVSGKRPGPRMFVCAAIHGDEINGVEIIRRLLKQKIINKLRGELIAIPVVNVHGFLAHSRYLPDRRDLNRTFPGSATGSLAARLAYSFMKEIVSQCTHGIDLHTGALHRDNLPHIRINLHDEETVSLAEAFGAPVILNSDLRDKSLREAAIEHGIKLLLYEAGEALRFNEVAIRAGVHGVINVLRALEMLPQKRRTVPKKPYVARASRWVRAPMSGIFITKVKLGTVTQKGAKLGIITEPLGEKENELVSPYEGVVIGINNLPLVNEGDALIHIARFGDVDAVADHIEEFQETIVPDDYYAR
jgi:predicted deacylase